MSGHAVTAITHPNAMINRQLAHLAEEKGFRVHHLANWGQWDPIAQYRLRHFIKEISPNAVICIGNRAVALGKCGAAGVAPRIARTPNYKTKRLGWMEAVFHTTLDLKEHLIKQGIAEGTLHHIPNMIRMPSSDKQRPVEFRSPPIVGTMGRFEAKKGFEDFIEALSLLKSRNVEFRAIIGGDGEDKAKLHALANKNGLNDTITWPGWVQDKTAFFQDCDIFCLPSRHEPFGIVLLEAMAYGKPIVSTDAEGPREVLTHDHDALIVPRSNTIEMADALEALLKHPSRAHSLGLKAHKTAQCDYSLEVMAQRLDAAVRAVVESSKPS